MNGSQLLEHLLSKDVLMPLAAVFVVVTWVVVKTIGRTIAAVSRERTRRDIAAYIAEGSMTPDQGEKLMKAGGEPPQI